MSLTAEQIQQNWIEFRKRINELFPTRAKEINAMYDHLEERMMMMPASGTDHFHNAFEGGYIDHVLRVMDCTTKLYESWKEMGADVSNFSYEELMFAAMHHDLGKAGFPGEGEEVYIVNDSEWHRKNQGSVFTQNGELNYMDVTHRALWLLQKYGIEFTQKEMIGIMLADGLYNKANEKYFISYSEEFALKTELPYILHWADHMSCRIESSEYKNGIKF
jgi:hypothetical protein